MPRVNRPGPGVVETDHDSCDEDGGLLDVVSEPVKRSPVYDGEKARRLMAECDRFTCFTRPSLAALNSEEEESEDEEMVGWEERIARDNWSAAQSKLFGKVIFFLLDSEQIFVENSEKNLYKLGKKIITCFQKYIVRKLSL